MDVEKLDSYLRIHVSSDKLSAFVTFNRLSDDFVVTPEQLQSFLEAKGIAYGLLPDVLKQICANPIAYFKDQTLVAAGKIARPGKDGYIRFFYDLESGQEKRPAEGQDGTIDFKEITKLKNVKKGQPIAELVEPMQGEPGRTVDGNELEAVFGKKAHFKLGKNVVVAGEKPMLYAAIDGMISITDKEKINVFPIYEVNGDVDYRVGNIDFVGTVIVRGNVLNGFKIKASGDIRVIGGVEGAEIETGGSIEITGGIMASGKGFIHAGQHVKSSFIQDANVVAGADVTVTQSIMHSNVKAGQHIVCSGTKGLIVGGLIQAGETVTARIIGNAMSTATTIEVGVQPQLREEFQGLRKSIRAAMENLDKTEKALVILDQMAAAGQLTPDRLAMRVKLTATRRQTSLDIDQQKERMLEIEKSLENTELSRINVSGIIFGGTKIVIGRYTKFIKDSSEHVYFKYYEGDVAMFPL